MLAGGAVGILGLVWLARRRRIVPACWLLGCLGIGLLGVAGFSVPVWYRFLLFAQVPLALGAALFLAAFDKRSIAWRAVTATLVVLLAVKVGTLFLLPQQNTYFGTGVQDTYEFSRIIPPAP